MDSERFARLCQLTPRDGGIGTLGEKTLHAVVKCYLESRPTCREVRVGRRVADIANEQGIWEIQTRGFQKLRSKLTDFLKRGPVTVVYPVPALKTLYWVDPATGALSPPRRSPKKGRELDILYEMYKIKDFLQNESLSFLVLLMEVEEYRLADGWSRQGHNGSTRIERVPTALVREAVFHRPSDFAPYLPSFERPFTAREFAVSVGRHVNFGNPALNVLLALGLVRCAGKQKNAYLYEYTPSFFASS